MMEVQQRKRPGRRRSTLLAEDPYKVLGLKKTADEGEVKKAYVSLVRQYTPESHPDIFQSVRRAYETLKDPESRRLYDLKRKYGKKLEREMDKAAEFMYREDFESAKKHLENILSIDPGHSYAKYTLASAYLFSGDKLKSDLLFDELIESAQEEEKVTYIVAHINAFLDSEEDETEALRLVEKYRRNYPNEKRLVFLHANTLLSLQRNQEATREIEQILPVPGKETSESLQILIFWLNCLLQEGKPQLLSKPVQRIKRVLKNLGEEDILWAQNLLFEEKQSWEDAGAYIHAETFYLLYGETIKKNTDYRNELKALSELARVEKELRKYAKSIHAFPPLYFELVAMFFHDVWSQEMLDQMEDKAEKEMEDAMPEEIAFGIVLVKKHFPIIYRYFEKYLSDLYETNVAGLNREMRRMIARGRLDFD